MITLNYNNGMLYINVDIIPRNRWNYSRKLLWWWRVQDLWLGGLIKECLWNKELFLIGLGAELKETLRRARTTQPGSGIHTCGCDFNLILSMIIVSFVCKLSLNQVQINLSNRTVLFPFFLSCSPHTPI